MGRHTADSKTPSDGNILRREIDYFCHLAVAPDFYGTVGNDAAFAKTDFFQQMGWMRHEQDDLYDPNYTDMLRVAFTSEFQRGRLADLVNLLSGRNFETRQYEEAIIEESFARVKRGISRFVNETHFKRFIMIVRSAGFVDASMIGSQTTLTFPDILSRTRWAPKAPDGGIERHGRRWFVMSVLTGRSSGSTGHSHAFSGRLGSA